MIIVYRLRFSLLYSQLSLCNFDSLFNGGNEHHSHLSSVLQFLQLNQIQTEETKKMDRIT